MICLFYGWSNAYIERTEAKAEAGVAANGVVGGDGSGASSAAQSKRGKEKKKAKMTMVESARFLASSEYLRLIATLVLGYGEGEKIISFRLPHRRL
jgi:AAA family ATP:ADP antiporter